MTRGQKKEWEIQFDKEGLWVVENYFRQKTYKTSFKLYLIFVYMGVLSTSSGFEVEMQACSL